MQDKDSISLARWTKSTTVKTPGTSMLDYTEHLGKDVARNRIQRSLVKVNQVRSVDFGKVRLEAEYRPADDSTWLLKHSLVEYVFSHIFVLQLSVSQSRNIKLTSFSIPMRRCKNLAFKKSWEHTTVVGMEGLDITNFPKWENLYMFLRARERSKCILLGRGTTIWWTRISRLDNIWKMGQHSTDRSTQEEIWRWVASQSSSGWKGRPSLLNVSSEEDRI